MSAVRAPSRATIAEGWQAALKVPRSAVLGADKYVPKVLLESIHTPYLGWVGERYAGGTVLVATNPGGGGASETTIRPADVDVERCALALRDSPDGELGKRLLDLTGAYARQLPTINLSRILFPVRDALGEELDELAFFNVCPYRTHGNRGVGTVGAFRACWTNIVNPLLRVLQPDTVVFLGDNKWLRGFEPLVRPRWLYFVQRSNGDGYITEKAAEVLQRIRGENEARRLSRAQRLRA